MATRGQCKGPVSGRCCADAESSQDATDRDRGTEGKVVDEVRGTVAATPQRFCSMEGLEQGRKEKPLFTLKGVLVRAGSVARWLECLPSMQEAPGSVPSTTYNRHGGACLIPAVWR